MTASMIWGTTNLIAIRKTIDVTKGWWPRWDTSKLALARAANKTAFDQRNPADDTNRELDYAAATAIMLDELAQFENLTQVVQYSSNAKDRIIDKIVNSFHKTRPSWTLENTNKTLSQKLDKMTKFEIYGLEKHLDVYGMTVGYEYTEGNLPSSKQIDLSIWYEYRNSQFDKLTIERRKNLQKEVLNRMERNINAKLGIMKNGRWRKGGKVAPEVKLFLAVEYPGCSSCGQGKEDKWDLESTPLPQHTLRDDHLDHRLTDEDHMMEYDADAREE